MLKKTIKNHIGTLSFVGMLGGFIDDVMKPLANVSGVLLGISLLAAAITGAILLYFKFKDGHLTQREKQISWFSFTVIFALIWGVFLGIKAFTPPQGAMAANFDSIEDVQSALMQISEQVEDVKSDTEAILEGIEDLKQSLQPVGPNAGIVEQPTTAQDFYGNAVLYRLQGQNQKAVEAYESYFEFNYPFLDPHLDYLGLLRYELSLEELQERYDVWAEGRDPLSPEALIAVRLESSRDDRLSAYQALHEEHGDQAMLLYFMMQEYSVGVADPFFQIHEAYTPSAIDRQVLLGLLESYQALPLNEGLQNYFVDSQALTRAQAFVSAQEAMFANEILLKSTLQPIDVQIYGAGEDYTVLFIVKDQAQKIWYAINSNDFVDTGTSDVSLGFTKQANNSANVALSAGEGTLKVKYMDANEQISPIYAYKIFVEEGGVRVEPTP